MDDLRGRVAVVTGAGSGMGLGMARAFAADGMKLVLADVDTAALDAAVAGFAAAGTEAIGVKTDVSKLEQVEALAQAALDRFGAIHVAANNAGIGIPTNTERMKLDDWRWIIDVDLWGVIYGVHVFLPIIEKQGEGHITATSSMAGLIAARIMGAYNVAKHGVVAMMCTLERDLRSRHSPVRASVLCPGPINTGIGRNSAQLRPSTLGQPPRDPATRGQVTGKIASNIEAMLAEGMDPDEVGRLVLDAVKTEKFWILTHPNFMKLVTRQNEAMLADRTLTRG